MISLITSIGARLVLGVFALLTSFYCLLAYVPFTYLQFLQFPHLGWLTLFVRFHAWIFLAVVVFVSATVIAESKLSSARLAAFSFLGGLAVLAVTLLIRPLLPNLGNGPASLFWSFGWLAPIVCWAGLDLVSCRGRISWGPGRRDDSSAEFAAAVLAAGSLAVVYLGVSYLRFGQQALVAGRSELAVIVLGYLVLFMILFASVNLIQAISGGFSRPPAASFLLCNLAATIGLALVLRRVVFPGIAFGGPAALASAVALAAAMLLAVAALKLRLCSVRRVEVRNGVSLFLSPLARGSLASWPGRAVVLAGLPTVAFLLASRTAVYDWNFIIQKLAALAVWATTFGCAYAALPCRETRDPGDSGTSSGRAVPLSTIVYLLTVVVTALGYRSLDLFWRTDDTADADLASEYTSFDVSFALLGEILAPPVEDKSFYAYLDANTNISRAVTVEPVELELVEELTATTGDKPHIFLFVIDSLRPDYLRPYNDAVTFTPEIERFAADSIVFEKAFTHYGATGLSQPSIWVGGLLVHQQYPQPFGPMNTLQKLLAVEGYESLLSMDTILDAILPSDFEAFDIDAQIDDKDYDFCRSLENLGQRLGSRSDASRPVFAYTQPQNIHVSAINRDGNNVLDDEDYGSFYGPYASRLRRMDRCFGSFLETLRSLGLFQNSIVILTADHGDSLGEEGRWGHAYTIFPEVLRVPLIVHLPESLGSRHTWDTSIIAFSSDLTPSLYYLLGHRPIIRHEAFGRPLFTLTIEEQTAYLRRDHMVASSYGAVYGILRDNGSLLFIADAVNYVDYLYDLRSGARQRVTSELKRDFEGQIRRHIEAIHELWRFDPALAAPR